MSDPVVGSFASEEGVSSVPRRREWVAMRSPISRSLRRKDALRRFFPERSESVHRVSTAPWLLFLLPGLLLGFLLAAALSGCSSSPSPTDGAPERAQRVGTNISARAVPSANTLLGADSLLAALETLYAAGQYAEMLTAAEQAARRYEASGAPVLRARTLNLMGDATRLMGDLDRARDHLQEAEHLAHLHLPDDPPAWQGILAATERRMAAVRWSQGRLDEAFTLLERALRRINADPVPDRSKRAAIYTALGVVQKGRGEYSRATEAYEKALEAYATVPDPSPLEVAVAHNNAGDLYAELGDTHRALRHYQQALAVYDSDPGDRHPLVGTIYNNIAIAHANRGEYEASLDASARALQIFRTNLGDRHPKVGWVLGTRASSLLRVDRTSDAMDAYRACVAIYRAAFGNNHPYTAAGLVGLGWGSCSWASMRPRSGRTRKPSRFAGHSTETDTPSSPACTT